MNTERSKDQLYDEQFDIEWELYQKLGVLIEAEWDSNTLKQKVESLYKQYYNVRHEIFLIEEKEDHSHKT